MKALAVHRFCGNAVRIIVEVLEPETQVSAVWDETEKGGIEVICPIKLHYKMIARRWVSIVLSFINFVPELIGFILYMLALQSFLSICDVESKNHHALLLAEV